MGAMQEGSINGIGLSVTINNREFEFRPDGERPFAKTRLLNHMRKSLQALGQPFPKTGKFLFYKLVALNG